MSKAMDKMRAARIELIRNYVFFGSVAMALELVEDSSLPYAAATDGKRVLFNPEMISKWTFGETVGVTCHEVLHIMLSHHLRIGARDPKKWNYACDYVVNAILKEQFTGRDRKATSPMLPSNCLFDPQYKDMSAEEVYNKIPDMEDGKGFDNVMDASVGMSDSEIVAEEVKIKATVKNAAALAKKAGQMSGTLERLVEAICEPKANWRSIVRDYLTSKAETDYNWSVPNQRMLSQYGVVYPTLDGEKLGDIGIIFDTSGSCYADLGQFVSELSDILSNYACDITLFYVDVDIVGVEAISQDDLPIKLSIHGGGGTAVGKVYKTLENDYDFDLLIHCTDGEIPDWGEVTTPICDVLVALTEKSNIKTIPTWAHVILID